jgi:hypothetical protein
MEAMIKGIFRTMDLATCEKDMLYWYIYGKDPDPWRRIFRILEGPDLRPLLVSVADPLL